VPNTVLIFYLYNLSFDIAHETVPTKVLFCVQSALKVTYEHLCIQKFGLVNLWTSGYIPFNIKCNLT